MALDEREETGGVLQVMTSWLGVASIMEIVRIPFLSGLEEGLVRRERGGDGVRIIRLRGKEGLGDTRRCTIRIRSFCDRTLVSISFLLSCRSACVMWCFVAQDGIRGAKMVT